MERLLTYPVPKILDLISENICILNVLIHGGMFWGFLGKSIMKCWEQSSEFSEVNLDGISRLCEAVSFSQKIYGRNS